MHCLCDRRTQPRVHQGVSRVGDVFFWKEGVQLHRLSRRPAPQRHPQQDLQDQGQVVHLRHRHHQRVTIRLSQNLAAPIPRGRGELSLPAVGQAPIQAEFEPDLRVQAEHKQPQDQQKQRVEVPGVQDNVKGRDHNALQARGGVLVVPELQEGVPHLRYPHQQHHQNFYCLRQLIIRHP